MVVFKTNSIIFKTDSNIIGLRNDLYWDENAGTVGHTDGGGAWTGANQWRNYEGTNTSWVPKSRAIIGNSGVGGNISVTGTQEVFDIIFRNHTETYTIAGTLRLRAGIKKNRTSSGISTFTGAMQIIGDNIWINQSLEGEVIISSIISGDYPITKVGIGEYVLSANNSYTGAITLSEGTLRNIANFTTGLGTGAATLVLNGGRLELANDTGRNYARNTTVTADSTISTERLTAGAGLNHQLGTLSIGAQTLTVESAVATSGEQVLIFGATTLTGSSTFTVNNGAGSRTKLTLGIVTGGTHNFTKTGDGLLSLEVTGSTGTGTYTVNGGVLRARDFNSLPGGFQKTGGTAHLTLNGGVFEVGRNTASFYRNLGTGGDQFQIIGGVSGFSAWNNTNVNFIVNQDSLQVVQWGSAYFNPTTFVLNAETANSGITFSNPLDLNGADRTIAVMTNTATLPGTISNSSGTAGLIKTGPGTLILSNASNSYNGSTTVNEGTLTLGAAGALPSGSDVVLAGGTLNNGGAFTNTAGVLTLSASSTIAMVLVTGSLSFASSVADWDTPNVNLTLTGGLGATSLRFGTDDTGLSAAQVARITHALLISGDPVPVTINASGYIRSDVSNGQWNGTTGNWSNPAIWTGGVIAKGQDATFTRLSTGGVITVDSNFSIGTINIGVGTIASSGGAKLDLNVSTGMPVIDNGNQFNASTLSADLTGDNGFNLNQQGSLTLLGNNDYTGGTNITRGTTLIGNANALSTGTITFAGGGIASSDTTNYTFANSIALTSTVYIGKSNVNNPTATGSGTLTFSNTGEVALGASSRNFYVGTGLSATFAAAFSGAFAISKYNPGELILTGASTFTDRVWVFEGWITVYSIGNWNGGPSPLGSQSSLDNGRIVLQMDGGGLKYLGTGETTNRQVDLRGGGLKIIDQSGTGLLKFTTNTATSVTGTRTLQLQGSTAGTGEFAGVILNSVGTTSLTKAGTGTWTISGINTYNGSTTVNDGILRVTGTIVSDTTINGGTLEGSDTDNGTSNVGSVTIANDVNAILRIGSFGNNQLNSGTLTFNGSNSRMVVDSTMNTFSKVNVTGNVTLNGVGLIFNEGITADGTYDLIDCSGSLSGTATIITNHTSKTLTLQHTGTKLQVEVS